MSENVIEIGFDVKGRFVVDSDKFLQETDFSGNTVALVAKGFRPEYNSTVRLIVALEVTGPDGRTKIIHSEKSMGELGLEALDYDKLEFTGCEAIKENEIVVD